MMNVNVTENLWIELNDGCRLSARLWLPENAIENPVPAILEYIPYRKRDGTRGRDEPIHGYFAANGYAAIRVDIRGSGESDGFLNDEYLPQEQDDAVEVIDWISRQPWCSGKVGMIGKSWGGFNCLQVAARRPAALKAIVPVCFTDDRFADDIHFMGGCLLNDNLWWGAIMTAWQARPVDPVIAGDGHMEKWMARLERLPLLPHLWLSHQTRDDYWRHGSVCENYDAIDCPVLAVGGWADGYSSPIFRLMQNLTVPAKAIIGPWAHLYPQSGTPGPAIGFLQEVLRWWDFWLKDKDTGIEKEPAIRAYIEDFTAPSAIRTNVPGRWVAEPTWPSPNITTRRYRLTNTGSLSEKNDGAKTKMSVKSPLTTGIAGGAWMAEGVPGESPGDQRIDDGAALVFDTDILTDDVDVLGAPVIHLKVKADAPSAQISVRLNDVAPDGSVSRVSYQVLNLAHRNGHTTPEDLDPDTFYDISIALHDCGHRFKAGHRIRMAIASAYWPIVWPAPRHATLTIESGASLDIPIRNTLADGDETKFELPLEGASAPCAVVKKGSVSRSVNHDFATGITTYRLACDGNLGGAAIHLKEPDIHLSHSLVEEMSLKDNDPLSARARVTQHIEMGREGWFTDIHLDVEMTGDENAFYIRGTLAINYNRKFLYEKNWQESVPRRFI